MEVLPLLFFVHALAHGPGWYGGGGLVLLFPRPPFPSGRDPHGIGSVFQRGRVGKEFALRLLHHEVIHQRQRHHGFHHGHGPRQDAGIVAALAPEFDFLSVSRDGFLCVFVSEQYKRRNKYNPSSEYRIARRAVQY